MAKKTKDFEEKEPKTIKRTTTKKKTSTSQKPKTAKTESKTKKVSSTTSKKTSTTAKKATATKKSTTTKKTTTAKKATRTKKSATTKTKKTASSKSKKTKVVQAPQFETEYYDLPYGYNKTVVKVLAQTPETLFVYWEVSEDDRNKLKGIYGENFFEVTKPVLIVYNDTLHYSFEIDINDFANSWYLHINDSKCDYRVELGRRPLPTANQIHNNSENAEHISQQVSYVPYYIYLTSSNEMTAPNNKMLFNPNQKTVHFRNVKTGQVMEKNISDFSFITNWGIFTIKDLYKHLYPDEDFEYENFFSGNPSSGNPSSGCFSSKFK